MKNILVTGGAGFIGSNFIHYLLSRYDEYNVINLDKLTYASDLENLAGVENDPRYKFVHRDIADIPAVEKVFNEFNVTDVIHFAAESHVDNSIENPGIFIQSNIVGTYNLLEVARQKWMKGIGEYHEQYLRSRFHHISTDEVFGTLGDDGLFTEETRYAPNSPYSASKASSDFLVRSYHHTYGMNVVTTNCSNNYGPFQHSEKLIPVIIRNALAHRPIPVYGDGLNIRDWLYVVDHCHGIDLVFREGKCGETYNIGGQNEKRNIDVVKMICKVLNEKKPYRYSYNQLISFVKDRPGHDRRYAIDSTKICNELGWRPLISFEEGIERTVKWYLKKFT